MIAHFMSAHEFSAVIQVLYMCVHNIGDIISEIMMSIPDQNIAMGKFGSMSLSVRSLNDSPVGSSQVRVQTKWFR